MSCGECVPNLATLTIYAIDLNQGSMTLITYCTNGCGEIYNVFEINGVNWGSTDGAQETPCQIDGCDEDASFIASFNDLSLELCYEHRDIGEGLRG